MSLKIYDRLTDIPKNVTYIKNVGLYLDRGGIVLPETDKVKELLLSIDNAIYVDGKYVRYPWKPALYSISHLSLGLKVLLGVVCAPNLCFDANACGYNILAELIHLDSGSIYLNFPFFAYTDVENADCDVIWRGKHFTDIFEYLDSTASMIREE